MRVSELQPFEDPALQVDDVVDVDLPPVLQLQREFLVQQPAHGGGDGIVAPADLVGVGHERNTYLHSVDERLQIPDRLNPNPFEITIVDYGGKILKSPPYRSCTLSEYPRPCASVL